MVLWCLSRWGSDGCWLAAQSIPLMYLSISGVLCTVCRHDQLTLNVPFGVFLVIIITLAASNKVVKYAGLSSQGEFVPIAAESHGPINRDALQFLSELGRRLVETTGDVLCSSVFVFISTDFRCGATFQFCFVE